MLKADLKKASNELARDALLANHKNAESALQDRLQSEKDRQNKALKERLQAKKNKMAADLIAG